VRPHNRGHSVNGDHEHPSEDHATQPGQRHVALEPGSPRDALGYSGILWDQREVRRMTPEEVAEWRAP